MAIDYRPENHAAPLTSDGPALPKSSTYPCCAWCGYVIPADCPDDDFDLGECSIRWRTWRNGTVPEAPPVEPVWVHTDSVPWDHADIPEPLHICGAWSRTKGGTQERCACGAVRYPPGYWYGRNTRTLRQAA